VARAQPLSCPRAKQLRGAHSEVRRHELLRVK